MKVFVIVIFVSFLVMNDGISPRVQKEVKKVQNYTIVKSDSLKVQKDVSLKFRHQRLILPIPASPPPFSSPFGEKISEKPKLPKPPSPPPPSDNNS